MALLYALFASFAAATIITSLFALTMSSRNFSDIGVKSGQARYLAEGGVEFAKHSLQDALANWKVPTSGSVALDGRQVAYTIVPTGFSSIQTDPAGIQTIVNGYQLGASTSFDQTSFTAHRLVNTQSTPLFQFAVYYANDLEIDPGPNMTLGGRVHSDKNLYLNCGGTLTCNTNYVHAVGSIYRNRKDDPSQSQGTVEIRRWVANPFSAQEPVAYVTMNSASQMANLGVASISGYDANFTHGYDQNGDGDFTDPHDWLPWSQGALAYWSEPANYANGTGSTVMDGAQGITAATTPQIGSIAMFEPTTGGDYVFDSASGTYVACAPGTGTFAMGYYHGQAGLSIITNASGTAWTAQDNLGNDVSAAIAASGAVTLGSIYDARQANGSPNKLQVTKIDIAKLKASGKFPSNGLLYAAQYGGGTGTNCKGVKLVGGSDIGAPLTVVSEDSIYIQGDYNAVNKHGAAVIADAVNLLSNAWNDTKTSTSALPKASNTTFDVAMISGNQDTIGSQYNGGLENLPRFHEDWSGKTCAITGSLVNTWHSRFATGAWVYGGNRYTAPNRVWSYDTAFNTVANLPPYTPMSVVAVDAAVW